MNELLRRITQIWIIIKYYAVLGPVLLFRIKKNVWLISERGDDARDNGYFFYLYMKKHHPSIKVKYVIKSNSADAVKINSADLIKYRSIKHIIYYISSKYLISTHIQGYSPEFRAFTKLDKKRLVYVRGKRIFLQHGITKDFMKSLTSSEVKLDLFICGAKPEYEYILKKFGFDNDVVKYTGFARFDSLVSNDNKTKILLMPTWRTYLFKMTKSDFVKSTYYINYNMLINSKKLVDFLEEKNIELIFYPHYEIQKFVNSFNPASKNVKIADFNNYDVQKLLKESSMLITDYSSVFFDFGYMKKPIVYFHFDYDEYRSRHYSDGYFSYTQNGFGPVFKNIDSVIDYIIKIVNDGFNVEKKYKYRINEMFLFRDTKNCDRIYDCIKKLK